MTFGVFLHRSDSIYEDVPSERYHFPRQYLTRAEQFVGDWIVYLEPSKVPGTRGYFAVAKVKDIVADTRSQDMFWALIEANSYLDFGQQVTFRVAGELVERGLLNEAGKISGRAQAAVRPISSQDFNRIINLGLVETETLPRVGNLNGFEETTSPFEIETPRERIVELTTRKVRDRNFRKNILRAYEKRCAVTGLKLINGGGRAEVEAAHIQGVEHGGPDIISNGIALSGTAHWMFDRGMIGLSDNMEIMVSRQANDASAIHALINKSGRLLLPNRPTEHPHPKFVQWHRNNLFKH